MFIIFLFWTTTTTTKTNSITGFNYYKLLLQPWVCMKTSPLHIWPRQFLPQSCVWSSGQPFSSPSIYPQSDWSNSALYASVMLFVFNHVSTAGKAAVQQSASVSLRVAHVVRKMSKSLTALIMSEGVNKAALNCNTWTRLLWLYTVTQNEYDNNIRNQQGYLGNGDMTLCFSSSLADLQPHMSCP